VFLKNAVGVNLLLRKMISKNKLKRD